VFDTQTQAVLQEVFRREGQSFLLYTHDSFPWTTSEEEPALERLQHLIASERNAWSWLGRFLLRNKVPLPILGTYPVNFTSFNFQTLDSLVPKLLDAEKHLLADLERDLPGVHDPAAKVELTKLADLKRRHMKELGGLLSAVPQTASA
jgi:hypothetical protein